MFTSETKGTETIEEFFWGGGGVVDHKESKSTGYKGDSRWRFLLFAFHRSSRLDWVYRISGIFLRHLGGSRSRLAFVGFGTGDPKSDDRLPRHVP